MTDVDERLTSAFASFRNEVGPLVRPGGIGPAQATVRSRRRRRTTVLAAVAVSAVPLAAYATLGSNPPTATPASVAASPPVTTSAPILAGSTPVAFVESARGGYQGRASVGMRNPTRSAQKYELTIRFTPGLKVVDDATCRTGSEPDTALCTGTIEALSNRMFTVGFTSSGRTGDVRIVRVRKLA